MRIFVALLVVLMMILSGCGILNDYLNSGTGTVNELTEESGDVGEVEDESEVNDEAVEEEVEEDESSPLTSGSDIERVLLQAREANKEIHSITIHADTIDSVDNIDSHKKITVNALLDPFVHYYKQEVISGYDEDGEWYSDDEAAYIADGEGGWFKMKNSAMNYAVKLMYSDGYYDNIIAAEELFEFTEDGKHYIITYIGTEEQYSQVFHGMVPEDLPFVELTGDMIEDLQNSMTGEFTAKFSKDTFLLAELVQNTQVSAKLSNGSEITVHTKNTYQYSYNEFDSLEIPEEVLSTAQEFSF